MNLPANTYLAAALAATLCLSAPAVAQPVPVANSQFTQGDDAPAAWSLVGGKGRWVDRSILQVTGGGSDSSYWRCEQRFTPGRLYHFQARGRGTPSEGSAIVGPAFANRDYQTPSPDWIWVGHVFRVPDDVERSYLRLGHWHAAGSLQFDAVRLTPALPVHKAVGDLLLGEGESIRDGRYTFAGSFRHQGSNYHRTLESATAGFNSDRWTYGGGQQITYRFALPGHKLLSGELSFNVNYHVRGGCLAEVSRDHATWHPLATQNGLGTVQAVLPADLLPAEELYVRLSAPVGGSSFQINRVEFQAKLDGRPPQGNGETLFADVETFEGRMPMEQMVLQSGGPSGRTQLLVTARNPSSEAVTATLAARVGSTGRNARALRTQETSIAAGGSSTFAVSLPEGPPGKHPIDLDLRVPGVGAVQTTVTLTVPDYYRADYGRLIAGVSGATGVWWCDATHKIAPQRPLPSDSSQSAQLSAARNDFEGVQIVLRPDAPLRGLTAEATELTGPNGATIPAANVQILRVAYHHVHQPTDKTGIRDWWPDALPPLKKPIDVPAETNQPLWVLICVPTGAKSGDYAGRVSLSADGWSAEVPLNLHVWDFALPERNHIETAFGMSAGSVFRYHQLETDADKRRVLDMYFQSFADHRISPYNPTPMDPIRVKFLPDADPPAAKLDFSAFDKAMARAVEKYHFTGIRLPVQGMGGGTFHARSEPTIGRFGKETPQYRATFSSYVGQLQDHLRSKGWLDLAYVYWFDEPAPKDYAFVTEGMQRLKKYAPGLRRMLTEEPGDELADSVDIWCPVSHNYRHQAAEARRAHGERFWWYVCTGPKAPYCTLFIDHPATELRVWLWQTWQRNIVGILVWQSNYWTSSAAFPDEPQNPYEDPMGYTSGYSTPRGVKRFWGNGDGRFIYPAEAAAVPGASGKGPVIEPPVSSIRWEMLREGIEDYEYLYLLRELIAKRRNGLSAEQIGKYEALLEVPEAITRDMTTFTTDPAPIYARRAAIAEAIERLAK